MKKLFFIVLLLAACGQENNQQPATDIFAADIEWSGAISASSYYADFQNTLDCLSYEFHEQPFKEPYYLIVVNRPFRCGSTTYASIGCYDINANIVYIFNDVYANSTVRHETVHWAAGLQNSDHSKPEFSICAGIFNQNNPDWMWQPSTAFLIAPQL